MYILQGKTWSTHHTFNTLDPHRVPDHTSHMVHVGNLSLVPMRMKHAPTHRRNLGDQRQTSPAVALGHLILPPSRQPWSRRERFRPSDYTTTSAYWAHIPACERYVQCLLVGANLSVLNRHRWGYNFGGVDFSRTTPQPSQPTASTFHLSARPVSG
jgi:hypothetical protein